MEIARSSPWVATTRWRHASTFVRSSKPLANALVLFLRLGERNSPAFERLLTLCQLRSSDALTFPNHQVWSFFLPTAYFLHKSTRLAQLAQLR